MPDLPSRALPVRRWLIPLVTLTISLLALSCADPALASIGVGVQATPVRLGQAAHPGGTYAFTPVYVVNTGTQPEWIRLSVHRLSRGRALTVPVAWIRLTGSAQRLDPHHARRIPLTLVVPRDARPGSYRSDIVAAGSAERSPGRANLGVAAATELRFTVAPGVIAGSWLPGWLPWALGGLLILAIAGAGIRRSGVRIRVERAGRLPQRGSWPRETP